MKKLILLIVCVALALAIAAPALAGGGIQFTTSYGNPAEKKSKYFDDYGETVWFQSSVHVTPGPGTDDKLRWWLGAGNTVTSITLHKVTPRKNQSSASLTLGSPSTDANGDGSATFDVAGLPGTNFHVRLNIDLDGDNTADVRVGTNIHLD